MFRDTYSLPETPTPLCKTTRPENVRKLIAWLEEGKGPDFNTGFIFNDSSQTVSSYQIPDFIARGEWCGTQACVAGHAVILAHLDRDLPPKSVDPYKIAEHYLGISRAERSRLFAIGRTPRSIPEAVGKLKALLNPT